MSLILGDAGRLPICNRSITTVYGDLPFGKLVGNHTDNELIYPMILDEIIRVTRPAGRVVLITHEIRLIERLLTQRSRRLKVAEVIKVKLGAMTPRIYRLEVTGD